MIDHLGLTVSDFKRSRAFYDAALRPLNIVAVAEVTAEQSGGGAHVGYGQTSGFFWLGEGDLVSGPMHVAFTAERRADVDAFYAAAMAAGGKDNGPPGPRPYYHPDYYGAFVLDPDGVNVEAVCRRPA